MDELWEQGYVTTTGSCGCVGMLDPSLGGGHGRYQGLYGLISDNFVRLNVVLANGTAIAVSNSSHADLLWAMKGAGHNFGVVTSFEFNIYPRIPSAMGTSIDNSTCDKACSASSPRPDCRSTT